MHFELTLPCPLAFLFRFEAEPRTKAALREPDSHDIGTSGQKPIWHMVRSPGLLIDVPRTAYRILEEEKVFLASELEQDAPLAFVFKYRLALNSIFRHLQSPAFAPIDFETCPMPTWPRGSAACACD